jgi:hypothetical protein
MNTRGRVAGRSSFLGLVLKGTKGGNHKMALYGAGYGMGKAMATLTGGILEDQRLAEGKAERESARALQADYQQRMLGLKERELGAEEDTARIARSTGALRMYLDTLEKTGDQEFAKAIYGRLDPGGDIPSVAWQGEKMTIDYPTFTLEGHAKAVKDAVGIIEANPDKLDQVLGQLVNTGVGKITRKKVEPKTATVGPGQSVVDVTTGQSIYSLPAEPKEDKFVAVPPGHVLVNPKTGTPVYTAPDKQEKGVKVSDLSTFVTATLTKYKLPKSVDIAGLTSADPAARNKAISGLLSGEESAYATIQQKAATGDKEAAQDLRDLQASYAAMKSILGIGQAEPQPAGAPGTLGGMVGRTAGMGAPAGQPVRAPIPTKKRAVFDPATGRFIGQ